MTGKGWERLVEVEGTAGFYHRRVGLLPDTEEEVKVCALNRGDHHCVLTSLSPQHLNKLNGDKV